MKRIFLIITLCIILIGCKEEMPLPGKIAFLATDRRTEKDVAICMMNEDGTERKILMKPSRIRGDAFVSPDGKKVAFILLPEKNKEDIYVLDIETGTQKRLTDDKFENGIDCWSPDSRRIAFTSNRDGSFEIYTMNADGSNVQKLTDGDKFIKNIAPLWSPDGKKIVFTKTGFDDPEWPTPAKSNEIYMINPDGSNLEKLTDRIDNWAMGWSPDGKKVLSYVYEEEEDSIALINVTNRIQEIILGKTGVFYKWSSDGRNIAFVDNNSFNKVYVIDVESKKSKQVIKIKGNVGYPYIWTPDGKKLIFTLGSPDGKNSDIYSLTLDGKLRNLTNTPDILETHPMWLSISTR
jgi:TolB protein